MGGNMMKYYGKYLPAVVLSGILLAFLLFGGVSETGAAYASGSQSVASQSGTIYYVAASGNDSWLGTESQPFKTFDHALKALKPGDTLYIRGGVYTEELVLPSSVSGSKGSYITISSAPGETATISGKGKKGPMLVDFDGADYVRLQNMKFTDAEGMWSCGISVEPGSHHIVIRNNEICGIKVNEPKKADHCANCIELYGDSTSHSIHDVWINGNKIHDCVTGWAECISVTGNCRNIRVNRNFIDNTGNIGIDFSGNYGYCSDPSLDFPRDCSASENQISRCVSPNADSYGIYVDGGQKIKIAGNLVEDSSGGIEIGAEKRPSKIEYSTSDIVVSGNTLKNNKVCAMSIGGYEKKLGWVLRVEISGNSCLDNGLDSAIITLNKCSRVTIENNVLKNTKGSGSVFSYSFSDKYIRHVTIRNNQL